MIRVPVGNDCVVTKGRCRSRALLAALLAVIAGAGCTAATISAREHAALDLSVPERATQLDPVCSEASLQPVCSEAHVIGDELLVDSGPPWAGPSRREVRLLRDKRVQYRVTLRATDTTLGSIRRGYSWTFEDWRELRNTRRLLVYTKALDTAVFVARIHVRQTSELGYALNATLTTRGPVARH